MGIRFQCPNGHKINVKAFLAGKRALCPQCGVKVLVPLESEAAPTLAAAITPAASNGSSTGVAAQRQTAAVASAAAAPAAPATVATAAPVSAHAAAPAVSPTFNTNLAAAAAVVSAPVVPISPAMPTGALLDPIAEAPQAVWYVRPRTGGQFGPAPGEVFQQWIAQRRVTADSLVWRDGWTDWRVASEVLPQLATRTPPAFAAIPGVAAAMPAMPVAAATDATASTPSARYIRARRSKSSTILAICVLGFVAIALVALLIYVLTRPT